jgi:hypothetical protein
MGVCAFGDDAVSACWPEIWSLSFTTLDGTKCRLWLAGELGDEVYYGVNVAALLDNEKKRKQRTVQSWKPTDCDVRSSATTSRFVTSRTRWES